jgi:hypothetical protein
LGGEGCGRRGRRPAPSVGVAGLASPSPPMSPAGHFGLKPPRGAKTESRT